MPIQSLFDETMATLQKSLNVGSLRHKALTSNIANIDTPNYKAFEVVMEDARKHNVRANRPIKLVRTQAQSPETGPTSRSVSVRKKPRPEQT